MIWHFVVYGLERRQSLWLWPLLRTSPVELHCLSYLYEHHIRPEETICTTFVWPQRQLICRCNKDTTCQGMCGPFPCDNHHHTKECSLRLNTDDDSLCFFLYLGCMLRRKLFCDITLIHWGYGYSYFLPMTCTNKSSLYCLLASVIESYLLQSLFCWILIFCVLQASLNQNCSMTTWGKHATKGIRDSRASRSWSSMSDIFSPDVAVPALTFIYLELSANGSFGRHQNNICHNSNNHVNVISTVWIV